ncbi:MAG TPA: methylated-DNA--[protein]-cysteine S-methyltransferase [Gaiellaceae bacterium]|nr:methylated-DNA--[protein]-cysteine S-methyltransferase [Gaiellaceae bacterium]
MAYVAEGWGVGELWLEGDRVFWSELPRPGPTADGRHALVGRLQAFFRGEPMGFDDVALDLEYPTSFQLALAQTLRTVPRGEVVSYGELAALAGRPGAARAAGTFCAQNRLAPFIPCHRVVAADGLGGYGSLGADYKRRLLALEDVQL